MATNKKNPATEPEQLPETEPVDTAPVEAAPDAEAPQPVEDDPEASFQMAFPMLDYASFQRYLAEHPENTLQPRFDVAEVYAPQGMQTSKPHIIYIENAF